MPTITICRELRSGYFTRRALAARLKRFPEEVTLPRKIAEYSVAGQTDIMVRPDRLRLVFPYLEIEPSQNHAKALFAAGVKMITTGKDDHVNDWVAVQKLLDISATASIRTLRKEGLNVKLEEPPFFRKTLFHKLVMAAAKNVQASYSCIEELGAVFGLCGAAKVLGDLHCLWDNSYPMLALIKNFLPLVAGGAYGYCAAMILTATGALLYRLARFPGDVRTYTAHLFGGKVPQKRLEGIEARMNASSKDPA
jgi:hypothetical protein